MMTNDNLTPLPTIGEMFRHFGFCFSDFGADQDEDEQRRRETLRKRLLRIAGGGDMQVAECHALIDELTVPLRTLSPTFGTRVNEWARWVTDHYRSLLPDLEAGTLSREQVLPVLAAHIFLPMAAHLVRECAPDGMARSWANGDRPATAQVMEGWISRLGMSQGEFARRHAALRPAFQDDQLPSLTSNISAWVRGRDLDTLSILHFYDGENDHLADLLLLARAFDRFWAAIPPAHHDRLRRVWRARLVAPAYETDLGDIARELREIGLADQRSLVLWAFTQENAAIVPLTDPGTSKAHGDLERAAAILDHMDVANPMPEMAWLLALQRARYFVLSGRYQEALEQYETAFAGARYSSGEMTKATLNELLIVTTFMERKSEGRPWADWALAVGFTPEVRDPVLAYISFFRPEAHYPERSNPRLTKALKSLKGRYAVLDPEWAEQRLDHRNKNRFRSGFGRIPKTELMIHAARGDARKVAALLAHGADANVVADDNSTALIQAIGSPECVELILPHCTPETINRVTKAKGNCALGLAVERVDPDLVARLIAAGADVHQSYGEMRFSPLYDAVRRCATCRPSPEDWLSDDTMRSALKHAPPLPEVFRHALVEDQVAAMRQMMAASMADPRHREILDELMGVVFDGPTKDRQRIVEILLEAGSAPNRPEPNWHDFTPFLLAAEMGDVPLFELLHRHGGRLDTVTAAGQSPLWLAAWKRQWDMVRHILSVATPKETAFLTGQAEKVHGTLPMDWMVRHGFQGWGRACH